MNLIDIYVYHTCYMLLCFLYYDHAQQMMYGPQGLAANDRQRIGIFLGVWHTYKQLNIMIWKRFLHTFLGTLFHTIAPGQMIFQKPALAQIGVILTMVRLCYNPRFQAKLDACIMKAEADAANHIHVAQLTHLKNFRDLFRYWIPLVSFNKDHIYQKRTIYKKI